MKRILIAAAVFAVIIGLAPSTGAQGQPCPKPSFRC